MAPDDEGPIRIAQIGEGLEGVLLTRETQQPAIVLAREIGEVIVVCPTFGFRLLIQN